LKSLEDLEKAEIKEHLSKCWMTHDAMWFYHCLQEVGMEKANRINIEAIRSMSVIEIRRIAKLLDWGKKIDSFEDLVTIMESAFSIVKADFMKFSYYSPEKNIFRWKAEECFAYEGVKRIGSIDGYQCGILERIKGWLQGLGIPYTMDPEIQGCLMHTHGACTGEFRVHLRDPGSAGDGGESKLGLLTSPRISSASCAGWRE
jgi:hypothetical protein